MYELNIVLISRFMVKSTIGYCSPDEDEGHVKMGYQEGRKLEAFESIDIISLTNTNNQTVITNTTTKKRILNFNLVVKVIGHHWLHLFF